jgi:hypothetical protein
LILYRLNRHDSMGLTEAEATVVALAVAAASNAVSPEHYMTAIQALCLCGDDASLLRLPVPLLVRRWGSADAPTAELRVVLGAARDELTSLRSPGTYVKRRPSW